MNAAPVPAAAYAHAMPFGAEVRSDGVRFRIWAPRHEHMRLRLCDREQSLPMAPERAGWHTFSTADAGAGTRYQFVLPDGTVVPDPASRYQPEDVHGASEVIDPYGYAWRNTDWPGRPWHETVLYELHVGCFTAEGTFRAAAQRLPHLAELGITAIELMPLADFPGRRNWGYDGVLPFAPDASYGHPDDLKALIDAAHDHRIMVFIDVVYNHFGPEGNYLGLYAPQFFSTRHRTPWGPGLNFDGRNSRPVRDFIVHNALYWLEEFQCDGLRLDAVHAISDDSPRHILEELSERVRQALPGRRVHLLLENERNEAQWLERDRQGEPRRYTAQWNDDAHHALHVAITGECEGYYADFARRTDWLARALAQGFAREKDGQPVPRGARGTAGAALPPDAFIAFLQNHDQVGNRAFGDRLAALADPAALRAATAICLLLPQTPMLFMGEEWHAREPFLFFCDFQEPLGEAVACGRRQEFAHFSAFSDEVARERIPDPQAPSTFLASKLDWSALEAPAGISALDRHRALLAVRRRHIEPLLPGMSGSGRFELITPAVVRVQWPTGAAELTLLANLASSPACGVRPTEGRLLWQEGQVSAQHLAPWTVRWTVRA